MFSGALAEVFESGAPHFNHHYSLSDLAAE
jgi:hypothetical protein